MPHTNSDVELCVKVMNAKAPSLARLWEYYRGRHPLAFNNPKLHEIFGRQVVFVKNKCDVIVNTTRNRLAVESWGYAPDDATRTQIQELWTETLCRPMADVHLSALVTGQGYLMIWPNKDGNVQAFYQDPGQVAVFYEGQDPYTPRMACKRWVEHGPSGAVWRLTLYYPDRIEKYAAKKETEDGKLFELIEDPELNEFGVIPVFEFRVSCQDPTGELTPGILSLQDSLNKLLNDMMVSSEYAGFPQRWAIGNFEEGPSKVGAATMIKVAPSPMGEQPAAFGTFASADPDAYLAPMNNVGNAMATESSTPLHFFTGQGGNPSGEALKALDAPLTAKIETYQKPFGRTWQDAMVFATVIQKMGVDAKAVKAIWMDPHTIQPLSKAQTLLTNTQAGLPLINLMRDELTEKELDQLREDIGEGVTVVGDAAQADQVRLQPPPLAADVQPAFEGIVRTADIAGEIANAGALARTIARRNTN